MFNNIDEFLKKANDNRPSSRDDKVLIIDSLNTFLRVFSSIPQISANGEHIGGIVGFLRSIGSNIREFNPSRCILVFDGVGGSARRKKIYPEYKSNRTGTNRMRRHEFATLEEEQFSMRKQMARIWQYLELLPVQTIMIDGIEADDTIAHLTMQYFEPKGSKVRIVSTDRDFLQLVSDNVEVYSPVKKKLYTPSEIEKEFNFHHNNYLIYRTIDGDTSDCIPGVNGIGLKTLLKEFPELKEAELDLDFFLEKCKRKIQEEKKPKKIFTSIVENEELLIRNRKLMQLQDTDISFNSKTRIIGMLESEVNKVDKVKFRKMMSEDYLVTEFKNFDSWIQTTFTTLNLWAKNDGTQKHF